MPGISAVSPPIRAQPASRTAFRDAADDGRALIGVELAGGEIVEEEQRLCALYNEVVDAHGDEVDADRIVAHPASMAIFSLVPTPSLAATRTGSLKARGLEVEQAAEAADLAIGAGAARRADGRLDLLDKQIAGIDIDACVAIGQAVSSRLAHADLRWLVRAV